MREAESVCVVRNENTKHRLAWAREPNLLNENSKVQNRLYSRDNVAREQKYTEQNQTEHRQVQHDEYVVHVSGEAQRNK